MKLAEKANLHKAQQKNELIAKVVAVASDEIANKVVEEVEEKQDLSAKVLKAKLNKKLMTILKI